MPRQSARERGKRWKRVWADGRVSLDHSGFASLFSFTNAEIGQANWEGALWDSLGSERLVARAADEGLTLMFAADVNPDTEAEITPHIPKIAGEPATLGRTLELQTKVRRILTRLAGTLDLVYRERNGQARTDWAHRAKCQGLPEGDLTTAPFNFTHFEEREAIFDLIKHEFNVPGSRSATIVPGSGFICFDDPGEDASNELAWVLMCLLERAFEEERPVVRRCLFCEAFFVHRTLKQKKFCSDRCRFNFHNKSLQTGNERG